MNISTELFTVTNLSDKLVSLPMVHVVALGESSRFSNRGTVATTAGGSIDTQETYEELVTMWQELTKTV